MKRLNKFLNKKFYDQLLSISNIVEEYWEMLYSEFFGKNFGGIITAPPAIIESLTESEDSRRVPDV